jgi:hypothetical protein
MFPISVRDVDTLRETHDEHQVNAYETKQITHHHSVDHHHERADRFETSAMERVKHNEEHLTLSMVFYTSQKQIVLCAVRKFYQ